MESSNHQVEPKLEELIELQRVQNDRLQQIHHINAKAFYAISVLLACILGVVIAFSVVTLVLLVAIL